MLIKFMGGRGGGPIAAYPVDTRREGARKPRRRCCAAISTGPAS